MPAVWIEKRKRKTGTRYRIRWRPISFDEAGRPHPGQGTEVGTWVTSSRLVEKAKDDKREELEALELGVAPKSKPKPLSDAAAQYLRHSKAHKDHKTYRNQDEPAVTSFVAFTGNRMLPGIVTEDIAKWEAHLAIVPLSNRFEPPETPGAERKNRIGYHPNTIRMRLRALRTAFRFFKTEGWIEKIPQFHMPHEVAVERVIPPSEQQAIFKEVSKRHARAYRFLLYTGLRLGELKATAGGRDLDGTDFFVDSDGDWAIKVHILKRKKSDPDRIKVIKLHPKILKDFPIMPPPPGPVFPDVSRDSLEHTLQAVAKRLGLPRTRCHDWRHTFCTRYMEKTGDLFGLMQVSGHKDFRSVQKYQHLTRGRSKAVLGLDFDPDLATEGTAAPIKSHTHESKLTVDASYS